jgi:acetolactate synthase-1/2/3 large subunit
VKVYQSLARLLRAAGVTAVFGVMGDGNMHWLAEYAALPGVRWCPAWHEAGAVGMADGYAVAASQPAGGQLAGLPDPGPTVGVATVTMGPGVAQALGALTAAVRTRSRVLVITAEPDHVPPPGSQDIDQRAWAHTAGASYRLVTGPADLRYAVAEAMAGASSGHPAVLAVPVSLMERDDSGQSDGGLTSGQRPAATATANAAADAAVSATATATAVGDDLAQPDWAVAQRGAPQPAALQAAAEVLASSQRPIVLLGRGAAADGAIPMVVDLGRQIGACFLTTVPAKGCLAAFGDPFDLGLTGTMASPAAHSVAGTADVALVVGAALDGHNTSGGSFFGDARLIRVDCRPASQLWSPGNQITNITSGSAAAIEQLSAAVTQLSGQLPADGRLGLRTAETAGLLASEPDRRAALAATQLADGLNPWAVIAAIDDAIADTAHIVTGVGHFWYFTAPYLSGRSGRTFHFGYGFGLIGQGIPLATGAAVAALDRGPARPTVVIEGDGSFLMNLQELQSAVRFGADLLVLVLNNEAYGSEFLKLGIAGLDPASGSFGHPVDITAVASALGAQSRRVRTLAELQAGLAAFTQCGGVRVLDIAIARSVMSEAYQRMHLPGGQAGHPVAEQKPTGALR